MVSHGRKQRLCSRSDELGNIHISEEVLAAISAAAALEVEGVSSLTNPSKKNAAKGVHIKLEEEKVVGHHVCPHGLWTHHP